METHEWIAAAMLVALATWMLIANGPSAVYAAPQEINGMQALGAGNAQGAAANGAGASQSAGSGTSSAAGGAGESITIPIKVVNGVYEPREIRVKEGTKVRLELDKNSFVGCMTTFNIWGLGISTSVRQNNIVEFVADKPGTYKTSCPMGMGDGRFIVEAAGGNEAAAAQNTAQAAASAPKGSSCGMGGGCGCGGGA